MPGHAFTALGHPKLGALPSLPTGSARPFRAIEPPIPPPWPSPETARRPEPGRAGQHPDQNVPASPVMPLPDSPFQGAPVEPLPATPPEGIPSETQPTPSKPRRESNVPGED